jgi:hypothetical protein
MKASTDLFVLLSEDAGLAGALAAAVAGDARLQIASSYAELVELAQQPRVRGLVVDAPSLAGAAAPRLERLRTEAPLARLLFVVAELPAHLLNELQPLRVDIVARPLPAQALALFVDRSLKAGRLKNKSVEAYIDLLASAHRLNGKEVSLFPVVLESETQAQACERLGLDDVVFSRTMRRLLRKCHMRSADRLAKSVLRDALLSTTPLTAGLVEPFASSSASF